MRGLSKQLLFLLVCFTPLAFSYEEKTPNHSFGLSISFQSLDYAEDVPAPGKSTESGFTPEFRLSYDGTFSENGWGLRAFAEAAFSQLYYNGTLSDGTPVYGDHDSQLASFELSAQKRLSDSNSHDYWLLYGGVGTNYWYRDTRTIADGYRERYLWFYLPVGIRYEYRAVPHWSFGMDLSVRVNVGGTIRGYLSDVGASDGDGSLGAAFGFRIQAAVNYIFNRTWLIEVCPFFEYRPIGSGDPFSVGLDGPVNEPSSRTLLIGVLIGPRISF